jgi:hypothetical protein
MAVKMRKTKRWKRRNRHKNLEIFLRFLNAERLRLAMSSFCLVLRSDGIHIRLIGFPRFF